jgi:DNA mismatch repair protein MutS2
MHEVRPPVVAAPAEVDVRGQRAAEACALVRAAIDSAAVAGRPRVLVIHGHGTGALRTAVREELRRHPLVERVDPAPPNEGGEGATYAVLDTPLAEGDRGRGHV